jgi:hypothetical protein
VIKLDIINEVVAKTGITKTKAELAVETVFESMKKALAGGSRIELRGFGSTCVRAKRGSGAIRAPELKCPFRQEGPCGSSRGKNCSRLTESFAPVLSGMFILQSKATLSG